MLFVLTYVLCILEVFTPQLFYVIPIWRGDDLMHMMSVSNFTYPLFMLCAFLLLRQISANRVVRLVTLVPAVAFGLDLAVRIFAFLIFSPDTFESLGTRHSISGSVGIALVFASIFSFACILKNCTQLLGSARVWVQLIFCVAITTIIFLFYRYMLVAVSERVDFIMQVDFMISPFYRIFHALVYIMLAIAYYKFAMSDLFSGVFDDSPAPAGAYSIVNKYWAAVLVAIVLFVVAMYLVLSNADKLLYV